MKKKNIESNLISAEREKEKDSAVALAQLLKKFTSKSKSKYVTSGKSGAYRADTRQKCVTKMNYSNSIDAHRFQLQHYLVKEGKGIDGSTPELYGTEMQEYQEHMADKNFRIFLCPQSNNIDLTNLTEMFVKKLEQQTGYKFYWQAANHYDTGHNHAHLLINGVDKNGKEVEIPRDVVKTFMREYARDICTSQLGRRSQKEIDIEKERELEAPRFTRLDNTIKGLCGDGMEVKLPRVFKDRERIHTRLENLRKIGMCNYSDGVYKFNPNWEESLRANARYNTFLTAKDDLKYTQPVNFKVYSGEQGKIMGKVTKIYSPKDDTSNNHAVIVEGLDGNADFIPMLKSPVMYDGKDKNGKSIKFGLKDGEFVTLATYLTQKGRLTPVIMKQDQRNLVREINSKNITGSLATEIQTRIYIYKKTKN